MLSDLRALAASNVRFGYYTALPALQYFPAASQRGAVPPGTDAKMLKRFACPKPEASSRIEKYC